ncbi:MULTISPECIES: HPF/RaiA family ribosome-associated protein [unclassified Janthinobacterium]|uniref:HPF/RaiA family ribosome-associated protein n=1 Tax=unclassified Janthinobacterium TaxID=2610881 RepID=UPI001622C799|nr:MULTISPECIES: HPF/RaiA family ribosome-associated protein [unclassified Janthinobacterium]MBB5369509.1 ribosome-associated translation inhibitor RaiA [Janthinobacterium sp. K2C7]MBB5382535.1 ribosome-associated translation inhibitor RaiA [Janthinobacterium sp. K2Li3]MBB5388112.1 ribosome-associated translation inhibitor RaiA [Janthinobacterium sp. K2E3]
MQININTDSTIAHTPGLTEHVQSVLENALSRFRDNLTRIEVHLSDTNGPKGGADDIRCVIEARVAGYQPIAVTEQNATVHQSISGATEKLKRAIESAMGRLHGNKRQASGKNAVADATEAEETAE